MVLFLQAWPNGIQAKPPLPINTHKRLSYLHRWVTWWTMTSNTWHYQELLRWFTNVCWYDQAMHYASALAQLHFLDHRASAPSRGWL